MRSMVVRSSARWALCVAQQARVRMYEDDHDRRRQFDMGEHDGLFLIVVQRSLVLRTAWY